MFSCYILTINEITIGPIQNLANARPAVSPAKSNRSSFRPEPEPEPEDDDNEGVQEEEEEEPPQESPSKRDKGKRKAEIYEEPDQDDVEDVIAQELENVGLGMYSDDDDQAVEDPPPPPVKKTKTDSKDQKGPTQGKKKKENIGMLLSYFLKVNLT